MALYQPTSIIPSSYTKGTVDVNDIMEISWQVNGNSAMTAFQIDFYLNDYASTPVTSTGRLTDGCPFYGTDRFGKPQFFTWSPNGQTWEEWSKFQLTNGNQYKYKITQWYKGNNSVVRCQANVALSVGKVYYFIVPPGVARVYFSVSSNLTVGANTVYYSYTNNEIWVDNGSRIVLCNGNYIENGTIQNDAIQVMGDVRGTALYELFVVQTSSNIVNAQARPTLTIYKSNEQYTDEIDFPNNGNLATSIGFFKAKYEQKQDAPIRWIRWQIASAMYNSENGKWTVGEILADTGDIYTPTLNYEFNGFFNKQQYAIRAIGESESGQECNSNPTTDGWIYFTINIENQGQYDGSFNVQCLNKENATLLEWEGIEVIPPATSPQGYEPQISNGSVTLNGKNGDTKYSVAWDKVMDKNGELQNMNFAPDWTAVWKGTIRNTVDATFLFGERLVSGRAYDCAFSPDGKLFAVGGNIQYGNSNRRYGFLFAHDNDVLSFITELPNLTASPHVCVFNIDSLLLMGENLYLVNDEGVVHLLELFEGTTFGAAFSPNGKLLVIKGYVYNVGMAVKVYSISNNTAVHLYDIAKPQTLEWADSNTIAFSPDGALLTIGLKGDGQHAVAVYAVEETNTTFLYNTIIDSVIYSLAFSPDGKLFAVGGGSKFFSTFTVSENSIVNPIEHYATSPVEKILFSGDGKLLIALLDSGMEIYMIRENMLFSLVYDRHVFAKNASALTSQDNRMILATCAENISSNPRLYVLNELVYPQGELFKIYDNDLVLFKKDFTIYCALNQNIVAAFDAPNSVVKATILFTPNSIDIYYYDGNGNSTVQRSPISYTQKQISSVSIYGGDNGAIVDSVSIFNNKESIVEIPTLYEKPDFEPVWNDKDKYTLYMTANFNGNLEGGTGTATGSGFRVYRQEIGKNILTPIATLPSTTTSVKDYGIVSRKAYKYLLYAYDSNGAFMNSVENEKVVATCFKNYSLLVCDYDETNEEYHVRKQYLFALNLSAGSVGNNNSPTLNANFTRYPTRMPSTQNYASGTLSGLIGAIYTVPALIEQIGNYKWAAKPSTLDYFDNVDLEKELYDLSTAPYQLFLRDMKGRLRMIATNGAISMTTNIKQKQQSISISFPWVEVGDASDVTIIQTPDDYGWSNDNQVLDVSLDVDVATGELSATYPFPYNGTKFYLTGVNKETLTAKTPLGVTPAQFELSETATQPDDGEVTATVKVNSEDN